MMTRTRWLRQLRMSDAKRARLKEWIESGEAQLHPLTFSQRELWEASPAPPSDVSNHICCVIDVRGLGEGFPLDKEGPEANRRARRKFPAPALLSARTGAAEKHREIGSPVPRSSEPTAPARFFPAGKKAATRPADRRRVGRPRHNPPAKSVPEHL